MKRVDLPVSRLSLAQKLDLMETIWADLTRDEEKLESPAWHKAVLEDREKAFKAGLKPKYDRTCFQRKSFPPDRACAIRFLSSDEGTTVVEDLIQGRVEFDNAELDDLIILRGD